MTSGDLRHILVVRTDRIGDVILTLPVAAELHRQLPACRVTMLVREYTQPLAQGQEGVSATMLYDRREREKPFREMLRDLRELRPDAAIITHARFRIALLAWLARIPVRVGTGYRWYSFLFNRRVFEHRKSGEKSEAAYNLALIAPLGLLIPERAAVRLSIPERECRMARQVQMEFGIRENEKFVILHPGSGGSACDWPAEKFGELARRLIGRSYRVVVSGSEAEKTLVERVSTAGGPGVITAVGHFSLMEYAAFISGAAAFVANSTGPLHVAAAVGAPVVGFYPPGRVMGPVRWGPLTDRKRILVPKGIRCPDNPRRTCDNTSCMERISVEDALNAVNELDGMSPR